MATVPIVTEKTYAEMAALIAASELNLALSYKITDRGDRGLLFRAAAPNRLENDGLRYMLCPATYASGLDAYDNDWIGVWNTTKQLTVTEGQLTIWNGLVWTAGATLSGDSPDTEASGWTVIPKASFTNHEYIEMIFNVTYDFEDDWINCQKDDNGNAICANKQYVENELELDFNPVDRTDWNIATNDVYFTKNICAGIWNNSNTGHIQNNNCLYFIQNNSNTGNIWFNYCEGIEYNAVNGNIEHNSNKLGIKGNTCLTIQYNSNYGAVQYNSINGVIKYNANMGNILDNSSLPETTVDIKYNINNGDITGVWYANVTDVVVDKIGTAE